MSSPMVSDDDEMMEEEQVPDNKNQFVARPYQYELFQHALNQNSILVLGTGSGKTFISILLIKELADEVRGDYPNCKRTIFIVNTVPLVYQQAKAITDHTDLTVGLYEGSMNVDFWTDDKWSAEIQRNEVLVFVAQVFLDLVIHGRISMKNINLLIVDECHHATGSHPMKEIMREYKEFKNIHPDETPRILGLTACIIHKKLRGDRVEKAIHELEMVMDSALVTATDQDTVRIFTTKPREMFVTYENKFVLNEYSDLVNAQLDCIITDIDEYEEVEAKDRSNLKRIIKNIQHVMATLGEWCCSRAIAFEMDYLQELCESESIPQLAVLEKEIADKLKKLCEFCLDKEVLFVNPKDHVTNKLQRLLDILERCSEFDSCILIFVDRRNIAKLLYDFLNILKEKDPKFENFNSEYVLGASNNPRGDVHLAELELRKQKETLRRFHKGETNILVATSVLEEGVDVRKCNCVIRFDPPPNFRSFVQSKGRARAVPSWYVMLEEENRISSLLEDITLYKSIEQYLQRVCHNRQLPTLDEINRHFKSDEFLSPYIPFGPLGPKVTMNSAISLINQYCSKLPQDKFTNLVPEFKMVKRNKTTNDSITQTLRNGNVEKVECTVHLPINSSFREVIKSDLCDNIDLAKKSAALKLCKCLHENKELNDMLKPIKNRFNAKLIEELEELVDIDDMNNVKLGTKTHKQIYTRQISNHLKHTDSSPTLYVLDIKHVNKINDDFDFQKSSRQRIGFIAASYLHTSQFNLTSGKWGEVEISFLKKRNVTLCNQELQMAQHFHELVLTELLHLNTYLMKFNWDNSMCIVPLDDKLNIDITLLNKISQYNDLCEPKADIKADLVINDSNYDNMVIKPWYKESKDLFYIFEIAKHLSPNSAFPELKKRYGSFKEYFEVKYDVSIKNDSQRLLHVKHVPKELNFIKPISYKTSAKKIGHEPFMVPELCTILPISLELWLQITLLPSVFHRLNGLNNAARIIQEVNFGYDLNDKLEFNWTDVILRDMNNRKKDNLSVHLSYHSNKKIRPSHIYQSLTTTSANDCFNLETLEILGDSLLKFAVSNYLFLKYPTEHEGVLTTNRSRFISNKTLYKMSKKNDIIGKIQHVDLVPSCNSNIGGFIVKPDLEEIIKAFGLSYDKWKDNSNESFLQQLDDSLFGSDICYNPWNEMLLPDKSCADVIEAMIGAYLVTTGEQGARQFLTWLGFPEFSDVNLSSSGLLKPEHSTYKIAKSFYMKYCLDRLEKKINYKFADLGYLVQAMTHPSYTQNTVTDCYQRLEFIGDAVLDYLITGHILIQNYRLKPGKITDARSYLVQNETLARVAVRFNLHKYIMHGSPLLQATMDKFIDLVLSDQTEFNYEDDTNVIDDVEIPKALGDIVESLIGAVYIDSMCSMETTWAVVKLLLSEELQKGMDIVPINCVRELYEQVNEVKFNKIVVEEGEMARCEVILPGIEPLYGCGKNSRVAKQAAAKIALHRLKQARLESFATAQCD